MIRTSLKRSENYTHPRQSIAKEMPRTQQDPTITSNRARVQTNGMPSFAASSSPLFVIIKKYRRAHNFLIQTSDPFISVRKYGARRKCYVIMIIMLNNQHVIREINKKRGTAGVIRQVRDRGYNFFSFPFCTRRENS